MPFGRAADMTNQQPQRPEDVNLDYVARTIGSFGQAQIDLLRSINSKLSFMVWIIIISIILTILASLLRL